VPRCLLAMEQEYVEMLAAGEDGQWKEMLPPMGSGPDIPKLFKSASKARIRRPPEPLDPLIQPHLLETSDATHGGSDPRRVLTGTGTWDRVKQAAYAQQGPVTALQCDRCETSS